MELKKEIAKIKKAAGAAALFGALMTALGYLLLPRYIRFPTQLEERLIFTLRADLFVLLWVVIAIGMVSHGRRQSAADIRGSAFGPPSSALAVKVAFLQNTLEQAFVAVVLHLALATALRGDELSLIVVAIVLFGVGRITFLLGYPKGAGGRAFGMVTTVLPSMAGFVLALVLMFAGR